MHVLFLVARVDAWVVLLLLVIDLSVGVPVRARASVLRRPCSGCFFSEGALVCASSKQRPLPP